MGRYWGQRSLFKCNWILLEGSHVPRPCSHVGESLETRLPEGCRQIQFPILFFVRKRKKEFIILNFFLCFLQGEKGIRIVSFAIAFMLSSEKGKRNASVWICFLFSLEKRQKECVSELCFSFCLERKKKKGKRKYCMGEFDFSFLVGQRPMKSAEIQNWFFSWTKSARTAK